MVSKRQRDARKRFRAENPELVKQPTPPKDPSKKKGKKSTFKRKKAPNGPDKPTKTSHSKHPLRVPGMRPGESCFICKATNHIAKLCPERAGWDKHKGGSCKICGGVTHLARDCPNKGNRDSMAAGGAFHSWNENQRPRGKVTKLVSGDDLDDDFSFVDKKRGGAKDEPVDMVGSASHSQESPVKSKKKQGPKAASGMAVSDECKLKFLELKAKRNHRYIIFKIEIQQVVVEKVGTKEETYDDFAASLPADECRYAVFDFDFTTVENCQKSKIFFIAWSPDTSKVRMKMVYASSKDRFKREMDGTQVELQATDPSEISLDIIKSRAL
ncbi:hypothetical protein ACE6H2_009011 [Prunus campanulata]